MAVSTETYSSTGTAITCSLAPASVGLAASLSVGRESAAIDNTSNKYTDAQIHLRVKLGALATGGAFMGNVIVLGAGSLNGTNYTSPCAGSDASITLPQPLGPDFWDDARPGDIIPGTGGLRFLTRLSAVGSASAATIDGLVPSLAACWDGVMPQKWSIFVLNQTGIALDTTEANHTKEYAGITITTA